LRTIPEPNREVPVVDEVDVLVVGGGPAGVGAAVSAARLGAKALIVEQFNCLGGVASSGGHNRFSLFTSWANDDGSFHEEVTPRELDP
jgi:ribulose 1,5-bisphosphate synthetase/thiazole synthase